MNPPPKKAVIISMTSDIGAALARRWVGYGWQVAGTYRTFSSAAADLQKSGVKMIRCDVADARSVTAACERLKCLGRWDALVLCPATLDPVGAFLAGRFEEWEKSVRVNFTGQMAVVHRLLKSRRSGKNPGPCVLFFAGGGTNSAPVNYSAYTVSKIALIKMCELLDAEIPDTRFVILGPGWVKTKIHRATLKAGRRAGENGSRTRERLASKRCTPMDRVLDCCDWAVRTPRQAISGRNFSVAYDAWESPSFEKKLTQDPNRYKLRRHGNED